MLKSKQNRSSLFFLVPLDLLSSTMKLTANIFLISIAMVQVVRAVNHVVSVAPSGSFTYSPNSVMAAVGDTIEFQFESNVFRRSFTI